MKMLKAAKDFCIEFIVFVMSRIKVCFQLYIQPTESENFNTEEII